MSMYLLLAGVPGNPSVNRGLEVLMPSDDNPPPETRLATTWQPLTRGLFAGCLRPGKLGQRGRDARRGTLPCLHRGRVDGGRLVCVAATVAGCALLSGLSPGMSRAILAVAAGGILAMLADTMFPRRCSTAARSWRWPPPSGSPAPCCSASRPVR
jgi:hypothetical protein